MGILLGNGVSVCRALHLFATHASSLTTRPTPGNSFAGGRVGLPPFRALTLCRTNPEQHTTLGGALMAHGMAAIGPEPRQPRAGREHQSTIAMMLCVAVLLAVSDPCSGRYPCPAALPPPPCTSQTLTMTCRCMACLYCRSAAAPPAVQCGHHTDPSRDACLKQAAAQVRWSWQGMRHQQRSRL
jgi:hypothetical protein